MKLKASLIILSLTIVSLMAFQNCGQFAAMPADGLSNLGSSADDSSSYIDGLPTGISQSGSIFKRDPATSAGNYLLPFSSDLSGYTTTVQITHLLPGANLSDGYANFAYDDAYSNAFASPTSALSFAPSDQHFDQVNAYYHVDRLIADMTGQKLFPSPYPLLKVYTHCQQDGAANNSFYSFDDHLLCLGYTDIGSQRIWAAQDADVVVHEFGHSLNHKYTSDEVWASTSDNGAMDEGFADLWAWRQNRSSKIAMWFGRAIYVAGGYTLYNTSVFPGLRDLDATKNYPTDLSYEVHSDSVYLSAVIKDLEVRAKLSSADIAKFEKHVIESLQFGHGLNDVALAIQDEAAALGIATADTLASLTSRGLLRKDLVSEVVLDSSRAAYVIDNHKFPDYQTSGNCNSALDAGETVLLFPNLRNSGALKGGVQVHLTTTSPSVTILSGAADGYFQRLPASSTYLASDLASVTKAGSSYLNRLSAGSFSVKVAAGATGTAHFNVQITTMNTLDSTAQTVMRSFDLPIGSVANVGGNCSGSGEMSVWP